MVERKRAYQICTNCIMDTTDSKIIFDEKGVCDHCKNFYTRILPNWHPDENSKKELETIFNKIKKKGAGKEYDCIIGVSGGADSSYLVYLAKQYGLKPILYSVDSNWNALCADDNIQKLVQYTGFDIYIDKMDEEQMMDFQLAFFKSQIASVDVQDVVIFSGLYKYAVSRKIKYVLTGANYSTEGVREPLEWVGLGIDKRLIKDINKKFGSMKWNKLPIVDILEYKIKYRYLKGMKIIYPLNYLPYKKDQAIEILEKEMNWQRYKRKHFESVFTRFYEGYWLIKKFGYNKRRAHLSSLILSRQIEREEALEKLNDASYQEEKALEDMEYICGKMGIMVEEFKKLMNMPNKKITDYKSKFVLIKFGTLLSKFFGREKRNIR